jgi:large subunit ribosomal protein L25
MVRAQVRDTFGKNLSRRLRREGRIPGIVYGRGLSTIAVKVDQREVERILHSDTGRNTFYTWISRSSQWIKS